MATLYLVRHGQASFGAADYDQLSQIGHSQGVRLGQYWRERGLRFDAVLTGTLRRQAQTYDAIAEGLGLRTEPERRPALNEYDPEALLRAIGAPLLPVADTAEHYRAHFRALREALTAWIEGRSQPSGMPSFSDFRAGLADLLAQIAATHGEQRDAHVLVVSSGGPISTAVSHVLGAASAANVIALNYAIRNSAVTELGFSRKRHTLQSFNGTAHLDHPDCAGWVTYT